MNMKKSHIRSSASRKVFNVFNYGVFFLFAFLCAYPLWYVVIYSLSDPEVLGADTVLLLPKGLSLTNILQTVKLRGIFDAFGISVARTVIGTVANLSCTTILAFIFTKETMPARKALYRFVIITMYVGGGMIPSFLVLKAYGLLNTFWVYVCGLINAYHMILIKTYMEQLPKELEESAVLDGANVMQVIVYVIVPLCTPILATCATYSAVGQWNSWFDNHIYNFNRPDLNCLQYVLYNYMNEAEELAELLSSSSEEINTSQMITPMGVKMTVTLITLIPIMAVYPFLQRFFIKGIMVGAVKG